MSEPLTGARPDLPLLRVQGPGDLVDLVPYLVGFHPNDSVVAIALRERGEHLGPTIRVDRAEVRGQAGFCTYLVGQLVRAGACGAVLVVYGEPGERVDATLPEMTLVAEFAAVTDEFGLELKDAIFVAGGRWWSYTCQNELCCPPEGTLVGGSRAGSRMAAEASYAGLVALPDRATLAGTLGPASSRSRSAVARAVARAAGEMARRAERDGGIEPWREASQARLRAALDRVLADGTSSWLSDAATARILVGLADIAVRDVGWLWMEEGAGRCPAGLELWRWLAQRAPSAYRAAPLFLAGWAAWREGAGALARIAVERALEIDPDYSAARLLDQALVQGLDPRSTPLLSEVDMQSARPPAGSTPSGPAASRSGPGRKPSVAAGVEHDDG